MIASVDWGADSSPGREGPVVKACYAPDSPEAPPAAGKCWTNAFHRNSRVERTALIFANDLLTGKCFLKRYRNRWKSTE
jgi:hypothetical protein